MIQIGQPSMIGVTFDNTNLRVAARVFNTAGPVSAWLLMNNFDGNSYNVAFTYPAIGAYSVKKVVFALSDTNFTVRDPNEPEADEAVQVVDLAAQVVPIIINRQVQSFSAVISTPATFQASVTAASNVVAIAQSK